MSILTTIATPLTLLCILLILRLRSNPSRLQALLLTSFFLPIQHFSLSHTSPIAASALHHRQLICATFGAALHAIAIATISLISYGIVALATILLTILLLANQQTLDPRIQNFLKELSSRFNINWTYTSRSTTTIDSSTDTTTVTTVTNTQQPPFQPHTTQQSDIVDKLITFAKFLTPVAANLPADFVNALTPYIMSPSNALLLMASPTHPTHLASVFDVIKLATAGAVGLWYTRLLLSSMWTAETSSTPSRALFKAFNTACWFLLGVIAQIYVSANTAYRDLFHSAPGAFRVAFLVFQFRLAVRIAEAVQTWFTHRYTTSYILLQAVKAFFVTYFALISWQVVVKALSMEAAKYATA